MQIFNIVEMNNCLRIFIFGIVISNVLSMCINQDILSSDNLKNHEIARPLVDVFHKNNEEYIKFKNNLHNEDGTLKSFGWTIYHQKAYINSFNEHDKLDNYDFFDEFGQTPIWWACRQCNKEAYFFLRKHGSVVKQVDKQDRTLLHAIVSGIKHNKKLTSLYLSNCLKIITDLLEHDVDPCIEDVRHHISSEYIQHILMKIPNKKMNMILNEINNKLKCYR